MRPYKGHKTAPLLAQELAQRLAQAIKKPPLLGALAQGLKGGIRWVGVFSGEAEFGGGGNRPSELCNR